ncbi:MAG: TrkA family potassium uptake protein [Clostridia bacterium]
MIIAGCGRLGSSLALRLAAEGNDVAVIDQLSKNFETLGHGFNGICVTGVPIDEDVLKKAEIESADVLIAATPDDNQNIMISQIAKKLYQVPVVITRTSTPEREQVLRKMGFDTICPTNLAANVLAEKLLAKGTVK